MFKMVCACIAWDSSAFEQTTNIWKGLDTGTDVDQLSGLSLLQHVGFPWSMLTLFAALHHQAGPIDYKYF